MLSDNSEIFRKIIKIEGINNIIVSIIKKYEKNNKIVKSNIEEF